MKVSQEEVDKKAAELSTREGVLVHPMIFPQDEGEDVVGYLREPSRLTKMRVMDKAMQGGQITAAYELFEAVLIRDASDPILTSEKPEHDKFILGATMAAFNLVTLAVDAYKKK